jgi:hypothetical protein
MEPDSYNVTFSGQLLVSVPQYFIPKHFTVLLFNIHYNLRINKQQDASSIQILFCHETLHVSGIFCAYHQELSAVHVAIGMFHALSYAAAT